jgi:hypothetical protein
MILSKPVAFPGQQKPMCCLTEPSSSVSAVDNKFSISGARRDKAQQKSRARDFSNYSSARPKTV